jgi:hypothetical protein
MNSGLFNPYDPISSEKKIILSEGPFSTFLHGNTKSGRRKLKIIQIYLMFWSLDPTHYTKIHEKLDFEKKAKSTAA